MCKKRSKDLRKKTDELEAHLHTITHDLRSPLTVILGHAELLEATFGAESGEGRLKEHIDAILTAGQQIDKMLDDLSDLTQLSGGKLELNPEKVELRSFIDDFLSRSQVVSEMSRVKAEIGPDLPPVNVDPACLERSLGNLLANALKYSGPDDDVHLRAEHVGDELVISVSDIGQGIPPEDLPHIFERFFRARNAGRKTGFGLGLFITRSLVESHGGRLWAESVPGAGSTFYLSLPLEKP